MIEIDKNEDNIAFNKTSMPGLSLIYADRFTKRG